MELNGAYEALHNLRPVFWGLASGTRLRSSLVVLFIAFACSAFQPAPLKKPVPRATPPPAPVLEGVVEGPDTKPVEKALVAAQTASDPSATAVSTYTDANGAFRLSLKSRGPYTVRIEAPGLAGRTLERVRPGSRLVVALQKGGVLQGTVRDGSTGLPVRWARVEGRDNRALSLPWVPHAGIVQTIADAFGKFRLEGLAVGLQTVTASARGYSRAWRTCFKLGITVDLYLFPGSSVSGTIWDSGNRPVIGALVSTEPEPPRVGGHTPAEVTDAKGRFELLGLEPGTYRLVVRHQKFAPTVVNDITVAGQVDAQTDVILGRGVPITGRLLDGAARPARGRIRVVRLDGRDPPSALDDVLSAEADSDGRFRLGPIPPGEHALTITTRGFAPKRVEAHVSEARGVDLGDILLETGLAIRGRVKDRSGQLVVDASIQAFQPWPLFEQKVETRSEADGSFVLAGLNPGTYRVSIVAPGYGQVERSVEVGAERLEVILRPAGSIVGEVIDETGRPIEAFRVSVRSTAAEVGAVLLGGPAPSRNVASPDGRFTLEDLAEGTYVLSVSAPERVMGTASGVKVTQGGLTDVGRIRLVAGGTIRGIVVDVGGTPIPGAAITVRGSGRDLLAFGIGPLPITDTAGGFEIKGAPVDTVSVTASHPDFAEGRVWGVEVDPAKGPAEVKIVLSHGGRIEGSLRKRDGTGVPGAMVQLAPLEPGGDALSTGPKIVATRRDGSFSFAHTPVGRARVMVMMGSAGRFSSEQTQEVDVHEGDTTLVEFVSQEILVSGRVTRAGAPAPGMRVTFRAQRNSSAILLFSAGADVSAPAEGPAYLTAVSQEDGSYELLIDQSGKAGVTVATLDGRVGFPMRTVEIPDVDAYVLELNYAAAPIAGIVLDKETDRPIAHASVFASPQRPAAGVGGAAGDTGPDGRFLLELDPGEYQVGAAAGEQGYGQAQTEVSVQADGAPEVRLALSRGLTLSGKVVDAGGRGVGGVIVTAAPEEGPGSSGFAQTPPDGHFKIEGLSLAPHSVVARSDLGSFAVRGGVTPGETELVLTLRPGGRVRIQVVGPAGKPLEGAVARVAQVDGVIVQTDARWTDAQGMTEIVAPAGAVEVLITKDRLEGRANVDVSPGTVASSQVALAERVGGKL